MCLQLLVGGTKSSKKVHANNQTLERQDGLWGHCGDKLLQMSLQFLSYFAHDRNKVGVHACGGRGGLTRRAAEIAHSECLLLPGPGLYQAQDTHLIHS